MVLYVYVISYVRVLCMYMLLYAVNTLGWARESSYRRRDDDDAPQRAALPRSRCCRHRGCLHFFYPILKLMPFVVETLHHLVVLALKVLKWREASRR